MRKARSKIRQRGTFHSVGQAVSRLIKDASNPDPAFSSRPINFWFRGEGQGYDDGNLIPTVFREVVRKVDGREEKQVFDEIGMFSLFRLRESEHRHSTKTTFDWLCLMQHYGLPSRLLDWTESPLVALYFAVKNEAYHDKHDGFVFMLSARELNERTHVVQNPLSFGIHVPEDFNTSIRAECANRPILESLFKIKSITECDETDGLNAPDFNSVLKRPDLPENARFLERLRMPVAVYPFRTNGRMVAQYSLVTLHGGRMPQDPPRAEGTSVGRPIHLHEINKGKPIIWKYRIHKAKKAEIKKDLERLGIHEGTLYPEVEHQATYSKRMWMVKSLSPDADS